MASTRSGVIKQTEQTQQEGTSDQLSQGRLRLVSWYTFGEPAGRQLFGPDDLAAYIERDDFDVQHVVVRRVRLPR
jgi:hypothetical protein